MSQLRPPVTRSNSDSNGMIALADRPDLPKLQSHSPMPARRPSKRRWLMLAAGCLLLLIGWWTWRHGASGEEQSGTAGASGLRGAGGAPVPVVAGNVERKDVPIYLDGLGTVQAFNTVTVHTRVDGQLDKVLFNEGQDVKAGDLLAQIDPRPFQAALDQAIAKKAQDEAQLANAQGDVRAQHRFAGKKVIDQSGFRHLQISDRSISSRGLWPTRRRSRARRLSSITRRSNRRSTDALAFDWSMSATSFTQQIRAASSLSRS